VDQRPAISIAIVTWNSERWIERCLDSIPAACEGLTAEIVVYDNGSDDATLARIEGRQSVRVIRSRTNDGFAAATNRAIAESQGRYLFLLNPDCELAPGAVARLVEFLDAHPDVAAAAPLLVDEGGDSQREFQLRRLPTLRSLTSEILLDQMLPRNGTTAHHRYRDLDLSTPQRIEQPAAAALLVRREVFDEIGPLDEQFSPAWFEDVDFCHRLALAGKEIFVVPAASARHFGGASLEHISFAHFNDVWYRNMWRYARKWLPKREAETLRWVIMVGMMLRCVAALVGVAHPEVGRMAAFRAYAAVLRHAFQRWNE
jgi:GT2 family glycosyltransferase